MPKIKVYGKFYTANIDVADREREWLEQLKLDILSNTLFNNNIIINLTWFGPEEEYLLNILDTYNPKETIIYLTASIDGIHWMYDSKFVKEITHKGFTYKIVGFGPDHWHSWMPKWIYENNLNTNVNLHKDFKYYFLSYNRKPKSHRHELVSKIIDNELLNKGWVTYTAGHFQEIDLYTGHTDKMLMNNDTRFSRPEDMATLGDLNIWNNCFCTVVTETEINDPWHITEKTWKPILGLRPYIIIGNKNLENILSKLNFYTSQDLLGIKINNIEDTIDYLKKLSIKSKKEIYEFYCNLLPKLEHNRNNLIEYSYNNKIL